MAVKDEEFLMYCAMLKRKTPQQRGGVKYKNLFPALMNFSP